MIENASPTLSLFYCYAREDTHLRDELDKHLAMLRQLGWIQSWSDRDISAGTDWQQAMDYHLGTANLLLLLVSADFINSDYCYGVELQQALKRHQAGEAIVMPILLRPVEWEKTPLSMLQALPRDGRPVTKWDHPDEALKQIATEIRTVVEALRRQVVVASLPQQRTIAVSLLTFFEAHGIPTWHTEHAPETTELQEAISESSAVVLITSSETCSASLLKEVRNLATLYQRPASTVWVVDPDQSKEQNAPPDAWDISISVDPEAEHQEEAFPALLYQVNRQRHNTAFPAIDPPQNVLIPLTEPRNPYKGLQAFTSDDVRDFFGRSTLIDELARSVETTLTLDKQGKQHARMMAVVGASGSGKSSVVMAGLQPCLRTGEVFDSETWVYLDPLVPGEHPIEALALALFEYFPEKSLQTLRNDLHDEGSRGLHLYATVLARRTNKTHSQVVLVVDQFEELFTLTTTEQERQQFINLLVTACTQQGGQLIAILTLRADFYDRPMQYPALYTLIEKHQTAILPMTQDDLRAVITQPAALPEVQVTFEGILVNDLLFDVQGQVGALPLLQFTLDQLFQQRNGHQLTRHAYQEMGGVKGALSHHAEQIYQNLPSPEHQACARALFLRLIDPGFTEQDTTRRRAALSEFTFVDAIQTQCMQETIEAFIKARLLTTNQSAGKTIIEVSHEALIREWKRLADWLREECNDILFQQSLSEDVAEWEQRKKPQDRLYRGAQLKEAKSWASRNRPSEQEAAFLQASTQQQVFSLMSLVTLAFVLISLLGTTGWFVATRPPDPTLVTTLQDNVYGSLRYCIENANRGSTIRFAQGLHGIIKLKESLSFPSDEPLTIQGPGANLVTISSISNSDTNIIVPPGAILTIAGLSFRNNKTIINAFLNNKGSLTLKNSILSNNETSSGSVAYGGGMYNEGALTVINSTLTGNMARGNTGDGQGGGIDNEGKLTVINSNFSNNISSSVSNTSFGGGIYNADTGMITVINSTFSGNRTSSDITNSYGGGIDNEGKLTVTNSTFSNNINSSKDTSDNNAISGGGIYNADTGTIAVINSAFSGNRVDNSNNVSEGGGIDNYGTLSVQGSRFFNNTASSSRNNGFGGGINNTGTATVSTSTFSKNTANSSSGSGQGGGIANSGNLIVSSSAIINNIANSTRGYNSFGGGIENAGMTIVINSTLSGNMANSSNGGSGRGGGIFNGGFEDYSKLIVSASTITNNTASSSRGYSIFGGSISFGGGINNPDGSQATISDSIIAANKASRAPDISGTLISDGYNLLTNEAGVTGLVRTDRQAALADLKLDAVQRNNGGPTQTLKLLPGSPAIDAVPENACKITFTDASGHTETITTDQRGDPRPDGSEGMCDIGAYESSY